MSAAMEPDRSEARLAVDIRRIRQRLNPDRLNDPQIRSELQELYKQVIPEFDQCRGRHRLSPSTSTAATSAVASAPVVPRPVRDARALARKPDPLAARTETELVASLREYREWSGDKSFRTMAARAGQKASSSAMCAALNSDHLPTLKVATAIVEGCGGSLDDQRAFAAAWRRIKRADAPAAGPPVLRIVPAAASS